MPAPSFDSRQKAALLTLLDDQSAATRKALLAHFTAQSIAAAQLLKEIAIGSNRILASHARWYLNELKIRDPIEEFRAFVRSLSYELETGALLMGRTIYPDIEVADVCRQLDEIASRCRELTAEPSSAREKCRVMNRVLFHEFGFHANLEHYSDPENSFLHKVLLRRKGIPISLCTVYLLVAQRLGFSLEPVGLPSHFVIGCFLDEKPFFVDAFDGGTFRNAGEMALRFKLYGHPANPGQLAPTPVREVLCRTCRNLINHFTAAGLLEQAKLFASFVEEFENTHARHSA
ncbi:MAG: hypothetical protein HS122_01015 [Opitutaceae bacterium]|nr:hypothetical protein [Opitutaceae bacterium]